MQPLPVCCDCCSHLHRCTVHTCLLVAGTGQNGFGLNWGNGFVTDQSTISSRGLSNPTNFFNQVVAKPYTKKVCDTGSRMLRDMTGALVLLVEYMATCATQSACVQT